ncbi:MAG: sarcosine oxidase subunit gamma [Gammaproteobacteria bacterium]|nr:MAG: sarcosine oxidase subunit gamma [Gammaproteobacteria bacterium]RKZ96203.1 MAG: sarcosine oxidase subunit gamma [Gammaproteobacteria bacterium]
MSSVSKSTPVAYFQEKLNPTWGEMNGMQVAISFDTADIEEVRKQKLGVTDVSCLDRFGVKGPQAAKWLALQNIHIPDVPNTWVLDNNILVLRLGSTEFLIEDQFSSNTCNQLNKAFKTNKVGVYKVLRADAAFVVSGREIRTMLSELCKLDFSEKSLTPNQVMMTQLADISVIVVPEIINGKLIIRLWCDGTYGAYMWRVLHQLAQELGGGAVGFSSYFGDE